MKYWLTTAAVLLALSQVPLLEAPTPQDHAPSFPEVPNFNVVPEFRDLYSITPTVWVEGEDGKAQPMGSACPVSPLVVMTAAHVVDDHKNVVLNLPVLPGEVALVFNGTVIAVDTARDLAWIRVDTNKDGEQPILRYFKVAKDKPPIGSRVRAVFMMGLQLDEKKGLPVVFSEGLFWGESSEDHATNAYTSLAASPGSSGGCMLNERGEAFAVVLGGFSWSNDLGGVPYWSTGRGAPIYGDRWKIPEKREKKK